MIRLKGNIKNANAAVGRGEKMQPIGTLAVFVFVWLLFSLSACLLVCVAFVWNRLAYLTGLEGKVFCACAAWMC